MIGSTISHYRILDRLGGGGMGVVYRALDLKLDRPVALKFLAAHRGAAEEHKRRFLREARAASALDHPNICTIYEIDETADGALFIAMALCEGETLREKIDRGPLPLPEAVGIAAQIADGLARAHERGVVHRDVKPANVIVSPAGQVKLVDFGIARLADQSRLTRAGSAVGTAAYMSPEQFHGEPADPRSDVWALGVVIHEMVTGRLPFDDADEREMVRAILGRAPEPMGARRSGVPPALERIVARALEKRPEGRYASMETMRSDLRGLAAALEGMPTGDEERTLVEIPAPPVLPPPGSPGVVDGLLGRPVGPYEILELLGGGGMGVVYKARDTRLSRTVALKFLPAELTRDPAAKERFVQEARAASSLDHPNLCTILELGETPDGRLYLAMPCYDGETLRRRMEGGLLPVDEAVDIAMQIARGLSKAHRSGIVHRDVKPANVMVTADGVVKILDFGLAKLAGSAAISQTGSSAGTPAYMSPEQARGDEVDARTDLWSLGVIFYELLAGRRPFRGEHEQAIIYSILHEKPRPLRELRPETPPELARIVERLLAREPADRYPSAEEALTDLRALRGEPMTGTTWSVRSAPPRRRASAWVWGALALAAAAGLAGLYLLSRSGQTGGAAPVQGTFRRLTEQEGRETFPSVSPDGRNFVYAKLASPGNYDIYSQRVNGSNPVALTADSPVDDTQPAFSPDGGAIAFRSERGGGGIFLMGATGESARRLTDFGFNPAWSPDGRQIAVATEGVSDPRVRKSTASQLWSVEVATGARRLVLEGDAVQPSWSPHGRRIAFWGIREGSARALWTVPAAGGRPELVLRDPFLNWSPAWSPDGRYLYFASNRGGSMNLWRIPVDEESGRTLGAPEAVTVPAEWSGFPSLTRDGKSILFAITESKANLERASLDPRRLAAGPLAPVTQGSRGVRSCDVSPDGQWVAFHASIPQDDLFVIRADGSGLRQLTNDDARDRYPRWSPDGSRLAFQSDRGGRYEIWTIRGDGSGLERVTPPDGDPAYPVWSPDGRFLALTLVNQGSGLVDLSLPLQGRKPAALPLSAGRLRFYPSSWSPDGRWIAGVADLVDGRPAPGIFLFAPGPRTYRKLVGFGEVPRWMPDGRSLLAFEDEGRQRIVAVDVRNGESREVLSSRPNSSFIAHCVSPDGRVLFVSQGSDEGDIGMLSLQ